MSLSDEVQNLVFHMRKADEIRESLIGRKIRINHVNRVDNLLLNIAKGDEGEIMFIDNTGLLYVKFEKFGKVTYAYLFAEDLEVGE